MAAAAAANAAVVSGPATVPVDSKQLEFEFLRSPLEATAKLVCKALPQSADSAERLRALFAEIQTHYSSSAWPSVSRAELLLAELRRRLPVNAAPVPTSVDTQRVATVLAVRDVSITAPPAEDAPLHGMKADPAQEGFTTEMRILRALPELSRLTQDVLHLFHVRGKPLFMGRPSNWIAHSGWRLVGFSPLFNAMLNAVDGSTVGASVNALFSVPELAAALVAGPPRPGANGTQAIASRDSINVDRAIADALRRDRNDHDAEIGATHAHGLSVRMRNKQTARMFSAAAVACHIKILDAAAKHATLNDAARSRIRAIVADINATVAPEKRHRVTLVRDDDADNTAWRGVGAGAAAAAKGTATAKPLWSSQAGDAKTFSAVRDAETVMKAVVWDTQTGKADNWYVFLSSVQRATHWCEFLWMSGLHPFSVPSRVGRGDPRTDAEAQLQYAMSIESPMSYTRLSSAFADTAWLYFGGELAIDELADRANRRIASEFEYPAPAAAAAPAGAKDSKDNKHGQPAAGAGAGAGRGSDRAEFLRRHVVEVKLQLERASSSLVAGRQKPLSDAAVRNITLIVTQLKTVLALKRPFRFTVDALQTRGYGALCVVLAVLDTTRHRTSLMKDVYSAIFSRSDLTVNQSKAKTLVSELYRDVHRTVFANTIVDHCMAYASSAKVAEPLYQAWCTRLRMAAYTQTRWGGTHAEGVSEFKANPELMTSLFALSDSVICHGRDGERRDPYSHKELLALAPHVSLEAREATLLRMLTESAGVKAVLWERIHALNALRVRRALSFHASIRHSETQKQLGDDLRNDTREAHLVVANMIRAECAPSSGPVHATHKRHDSLLAHEWKGVFGASPTAVPEVEHVDTASVRRNFDAALGSKSGTGAWLTAKGMLLSAFLDAINGLATLREHRESGRVVRTLRVTPARLIECASIFFAVTTRCLWHNKRDPATNQSVLNGDDVIVAPLLARMDKDLADARVPQALASRVRRVLFRGDAAGANRLLALAKSKHSGETAFVEYCEWVVMATRAQTRFIGTPRAGARRSALSVPTLEGVEAHVTDGVFLVAYRSVATPVFLKLNPALPASSLLAVVGRDEKSPSSEPTVVAAAGEAAPAAEENDDTAAAANAEAAASVAATVLGNDDNDGSADTDADTSGDDL